MSSPTGAPWLLYGAYGFTGRLLAEEAVARGHRPILAGRDETRLRTLGEALNCPVRPFALDDPGALRQGLEGVAAVLHAAGPFLHTAPAMLQEAISQRVHYLDITGEVPVLETVFGHDAAARAAGIALLPGVGMDVIPTDTVAALLAERLPTADRLDLALRSGGGASAGTLRTVVTHLGEGLWIRRGGALRRASPGRREFLRTIDFGPGTEGGTRWVAPYTWGDLATAPRTTGIGNVTCYMARSRREVRLLPWALPFLQLLFSTAPVRALAMRRIRAGPPGPDTETRRRARARIWGRVQDPSGRVATLGLETMEGYRFTAVAGIRALEALLDRPALVGALTPARAFGPRWALGLPETHLVEMDRPA